MTFDWITWSVEALGIVILAVWIVLPIGEFRFILRGMLARRNAEARATPQKQPGPATEPRDFH